MRYFQTNPHWYPFHADKCHHFPEVVTTVDAAGQVVELFAERVVETQIHLEDCLQSIEAQKCILCIETAKSWLQDMISASLELILLAHWLSQKLSVWFSYQFLAGSSRFTYSEWKNWHHLCRWGSLLRQVCRKLNKDRWASLQCYEEKSGIFEFCMCLLIPLWSRCNLLFASSQLMFSVFHLLQELMLSRKTWSRKGKWCIEVIEESRGKL